MKLSGSWPQLPIDALLPEVTASLQRAPNLVLEAEPGAGKTTRVPPALLALVPGEIVVLEPRRLAARMAARRVASELGEQVGQTVGYQVRFDEAISAQTRLRFVTEGILTRQLLAEPLLPHVDAVVLDEFHERHLDSDLALALLKRLQQRRPELKLVVMSATLHSRPISAFLNDCPVLRSHGRVFPLSIEHRPYSPEPLHVQVRQAVQRLQGEGQSGHILVFLPGAAEIRRAAHECQALADAAGMLLLPLHGDLSPAEQDRAVLPGSQQKLLLATNVAESSITIDGVSAVIDSGLARVAEYSPWTGLPTLHIKRISKASARQRAGRAGRTGPGRVLRLYAQEDFAHRPEHDVPEILRSDLSQMCLALRAMHVPDPAELQWLDPPPKAALHYAESLLDRLGARDDVAQQLARYPLPPRLARLLVEAVARGVGEEGCLAAALLGSGSRLEENDLLTALERFHSTPDTRILQHLQQLRRIARPSPQREHNDEALLLSVLSGFPDRVARLRAGNQVQLANGAAAEIAGQPPPYEFMVVVDAEDRQEKPLPLVRLTARIEPEWLLDLFPDRVREEVRHQWLREAERVEASSVLLYDELLIQEPVAIRPDEGEAAKLLFARALEAGLERFVDREALEAACARIAFAGLEQPDVSHLFAQLCVGLHSFAELERAAKGLISTVEASVDPRQLRELAPATINLKNGRQTKVHYERGKPPWIASRLQDLFGMRETPRLGREHTAVVIHLLAPNQRAVQTTSDLAGFWERLYPQVRRELMRRYPKHAWPERP